jgi:type I restriction enzyme, S subunit
MIWNTVKLGDLLVESRIESDEPDPDKRITVRLNLKGVEKRPFEAGVEGGTKYYVRKAGQFIYGKQNLFKGAFGIVPNELDGFESSQDIPAFDVRKDCLPEWITYYFNQNDYYKTLESLATGTGSRRIQPTRLFELEIPLPDIQEQNRIIKSIKKLEGRFDNLFVEIDQQLSCLQLLRRTFLQEAVQGKLTKQEANDEPASELLKRIIAEKQKLIKEGKLKKEKELPPITEDEIPFELPKGWVCCRLTDIGKFCGGGTPSTNNVDYWSGNIPWVTPKDMKDEIITKSIDHISQAAINNSSAKLIDRGSILIVVRGMVLIKAIPIAINEVTVTINQDMKAITMYVQELNKYIQLFLLARQNELKAVVERSTHGTGKLDTEILTHLPIPLPPLAEQRRIVAKVQQLQKQLHHLETQGQQSRQYAQQLLQTILKDAFEDDKGQRVNNGQIALATPE